MVRFFFLSKLFSLLHPQLINFLRFIGRADEASIEVIKRLLLTSGASHQSISFFFLGCCRGDEMTGDHQIWNMISSVKHFSITPTIIELTCMNQDTMNTLVSDVLCLPPRLTRSLSDILYHKTKGNPLFFCQLMISLNREGLLSVSLSRRRWEWDEEKIQSRKIPENVAVFFSKTIKELPQDVQIALRVMSCFGACSKISLIETLEQVLNSPLARYLDVAVSEGLLTKSDGRYHFAHDRVQEAAYEMMKPEDRCLYHFQYGLALCSTNIFDMNNDIIFTAVNQINRGGPAAVSKPSQSSTLANLNLTAGKRAVGMSDFRSAFVFFDNGINFLRKNHWKEHYDLSLQLFDGAAKCSFFIGDNLNLNLLTEQILTYAKTFDDKLNVMYITVSALSYASRLPESIEKGMVILSKLGEPLPESTSDDDIDSCIEQTLFMLNQYRDRDLTEYKRMTDSSKIKAMKFLARLETPCGMARPDLQPFVAIKKVHLSLTYGMCPFSSVGFAHFGALLAKRGNLSDGYSYSKIGKNLLRIIGSKEVAGEVICVSTHVFCFVEPVQSTNEFYLEGHKAAMAVGDMINAMLNIIIHNVNCFWIGSSLPTVRKGFESTRFLLEQQNHETFLSQILPIMRNLSRLIGTNNNGNTPSYDETAMEHSLLSRNPFQATTFIFQKLYISFIFREYDQMKSLAEQYFQLPFRSWTLLFSTSARVFISGLVSFWIYRQTGEIIWVERGRNAKKMLSHWAESTEWNFSNKFYLLEAEEYWCNDDRENAKASYNKAIYYAKEHKFVNEEALTCELAGYFHLSLGDRNNAVNYFTQAHESYHQWGAFAKTSKVYEFVQSEFGFVQRVLTPNSLPLSQNDHLDVENVPRKRVSSNQ